ncbi:hypothetical protein FRC07_014839 [Ceratobasidium sp. 392]|nr:hypothetical protein FRC07_014839 [Ceratobasidium sp. 392]
MSANMDPYRRLTYLILDGNKTGALGRVNIPGDSSNYFKLIGLDLVELLKEQIKWDHRAMVVKLFKVEMTE